MPDSTQFAGREDRDNIIKQKTFLLMVPLFAIAGLLWGGMYYYFQERTAAFIPAGYGLIAIISLLIYRRRKNFKTFRTTQLILILLLPCLLHLSLGDFVSSSAVVLWGTLCPLGALAFHNTKAAGYWFALYIFLLITVFILQNRVFHIVSVLPPGLINILFAMNIASVTFLTFIVLRYFVNQNQLVKLKLDEEQRLLKIEREKSEKLLLNILPAPVAMRLKEGEQIIADEYPGSAIMFADIVGFTNVSRDISPALLVENLNKIFTHFDKLAEEHGLEKIKTIGDSYMVASGLSGHKNCHLSNIADLALAIVSTIKEFSLDGQTKCEIRIGIHMGPIIAGVIGAKKFSYDIWGDAVNTASRMEKFGEAGKIQISQAFFDKIKDDYNCQYRGKIDIKGKGEMELYFLLNKK
jgi:guanylate cyclase